MLTLVYGYGVSGKSAVKCLQSLGREVAIYTDNIGGNFDGITDLSGLPIDDVLKQVGLIVISPSIR